MSKKQKTQKQQNAESASYKLNTKAVDRLVNADKKTYPNTKADPGKQYRSKGFIDRIPEPIKALFIKFWFNGAVCFFIGFGLAGFLKDTLDLIVVLGVVIGIVTDILVNNTFHFFAITPGSNNKWMMFPQKKFWTFFANVAYSVVVVFLVAWIYDLLILAFTSIGVTNVLGIGLGFEPVSFGVLCVAVDMVFIGFKNLFIKIINEAKEKNK